MIALLGILKGQFTSFQSLIHVRLFANGLKTQGFPVHHQLLGLTQTHVHRVGDAIQPSHSFSSRLQTFLASGSFPMSQFLTSGG